MDQNCIVNTPIYILQLPNSSSAHTQALILGELPLKLKLYLNSHLSRYVPDGGTSIFWHFGFSLGVGEG